MPRYVSGAKTFGINGNSALITAQSTAPSASWVAVLRFLFVDFLLFVSAPSLLLPLIVFVAVAHKAQETVVAPVPLVSGQCTQFQAF